MITCQHAKHLFDRYLDGELSPSLQAELHAHQLRCGDCQGELALLEACGDVVAYDRCEPTLSASFTDRVLLANRAQMASSPRRNWGRLFISIASPVAAAASIALAVLLIGPAAPTTKTLKAGYLVQASDQNIDILGGADKRLRLEPQAATVRQLQPGFVDVILDPVVKQTRHTLDSTRRSLEQLESLVGLGFSGANNALAAGRRNVESDRPQPGAMSNPNVNGPDLFAPLPYGAPVAPDPSNTSEFDDTIEAL